MPYQLCRVSGRKRGQFILHVLVRKSRCDQRHRLALPGSSGENGLPTIRVVACTKRWARKVRLMRKDLDAELPSHVEQTVQPIAALHGQHQS
jgi:hypothetical protein